MGKNSFAKECMRESHPDWQYSVSRMNDLYSRGNDIRSEFGRDYTRILHSTAYRRLKHKTQVFFTTKNDHICTRIEHVNHVASVSYTIANYLGLNVELVRAIATGHDLGHAPFGHQGELILNKIASDIGYSFWHEAQSLRVVDKLDTLVDINGKEQNLLLTYAVRDGLISHCGEVDENAIRPRQNYFSLDNITRPNQYQPFTWEGCVVKISDKIAYLGRDIEDALTLNIIGKEDITELIQLINDRLNINMRFFSNTVLMHEFIIAICTDSSPDEGLILSSKYLELMDAVKKFNYNNIYGNERLKYYKEYAELIIKSIYDVLGQCNKGEETLNEVRRLGQSYRTLGQYFCEWLEKYSDIGRCFGQNSYQYNNDIIYNISTNPKCYSIACIDFIAGMTDNFADKIFTELTTL